MKQSQLLELDLMAHRYLYYVACDPAVSDHEYDELELEARRLCPPESPVHKVGSSLISSYTQEQIKRADKLFKI